MHAPQFIVNAIYSNDGNMVEVLQGYLEEPFLMVGAEIFTYAKLGSVIGHEIMHALDSDGSNFLVNETNLLSIESAQKYVGIQECLINQMNNLTFKDIKGDGLFTLDENFADVFGLKLSYRATKRLVEHGKIHVKFAGITDEPWERVFFSAFAQRSCTILAREMSQIQDVHPKNPLRTMSALMNNREFSKAFDCVPQSRMNPTTKCDI
ncbi:NEP5 polyprotein [Cichlidogyrus casuarinus]|uniref:NEP5 polyprotein n=1 Tax=Cichlidogyrus casuarinus TaxID=1844966 RepID=A0ABD2Q4H1_9PLAT